MTRLADTRSIMGIDPTPRGLAFVAFERGALLDWGVRLAGSNAEALEVLDELLDRCATEVLVLEDADAPHCLRRARIRVLLRSIARRAQKRGIEVICLSRGAVRASWRGRGIRNKYVTAREIADLFPELQPLVPKPRRSYDVEGSRVQTFDAGSLVLEAFGVEQESGAA